MSRENESRFQDLYRRYYRSVVGYFMGHGFSAEKARDLAQDTFVRVYQGMEIFRDERDESAWAFIRTTARRLALNDLRNRATLKRNARETSLDSSLQPAESISEDPWTGAQPKSPETELIEREEGSRRQRQLQRAVENLPQSLRTCVLLQLEGCSYREIMKRMNLSLDAVKSRLNEARHRLREQLGDDPGGLEPSAWSLEDHQ